MAEIVLLSDESVAGWELQRNHILLRTSRGFIAILKASLNRRLECFDLCLTLFQGVDHQCYRAIQCTRFSAEVAAQALLRLSVEVVTSCQIHHNVPEYTFCDGGEPSGRGGF